MAQSWTEVAMEPEQVATSANDVALTKVLGLLFATTVVLLVLTEHFRELPGVLAAFASARYIFRL